MNAPARLASPADQRRKGMIAKLHIAKGQLGLADDDYRAVLLRETGRLSAADCTAPELERALKAFERQGFTAKARRPGPKPANHPVARKARALWISLHQLGAVRDPGEAALEAFARRQLGCARMQWADQRLGYRLIEALKAMADRAGWSQDLTGVRPAATLGVLKRRLVDALLAKLVEAGVAPADWTVERAAREFGGLEVEWARVASAEELDRVAQLFARTLACCS